MTRTNYIEQSIPHESAKKHITGLATYTDDMAEPTGLLHAAIGYSNKALANIKKINLDKVLKSEGVEAIVTHRDIPKWQNGELETWLNLCRGQGDGREEQARSWQTEGLRTLDLILAYKQSYQTGETICLNRWED